jgi:hypothetical protein
MRPEGSHDNQKFQKNFKIFDFFDVQEPLGIPEEKQVRIFFQKISKFKKHWEIPRDSETSKNEKNHE